MTKGISAAKAHRRSLRRREVNRRRNRTIRTLIRRARESIAESSAEGSQAAQDAVQRAMVALDRARSKGTLHARNVDRRKSRLARLLSRAQAA